MSHIFISYKREEQPTARRLADVFEKKGWSVWWDPELRAGETFDAVIERELKAAKLVIALWSKRSVMSKYIYREAKYAWENDKLVSVMIEDVDPPFLFRDIQTGSLVDWNGSDNFPGFQKLISDLTIILGEPPIEIKEAGRAAEEKHQRKQEEERRKAEERRKFEEEQKRVEVERKVEEERKRKAEAPTPQQKITNTIGMEFVLIPAGSFIMGSPMSPKELAERFGGENEWYECEKPQHAVKIERPFYLQTTPVTQGQWQRAMGYNDSHFKDCGDDCPVENVSWADAHKFIEKINQAEKIKDYRLPSEAEWEYACRAGSKTEFFFGDDAERLGEFAWFGENSGGRTHPVKKRSPNSWGLYDIHGNVWEWVEDDWHIYYKVDPADGRAWVSASRGSARVLRGGGWNCLAHVCRSAARFSSAHSDRREDAGFRIASYNIGYTVEDS
jgi:formylglycine-generating enzyme required for sulfatase activity